MSSSPPSTTPLASQIAALEESYYDENHKRLFFNKNSQKFDCANAIAQTIPIADLCATAIRRPHPVSAPNLIFLDYPLLKSFASPETFPHIAAYGLQILNETIAANGSYRVHINLKGLTISAVDRYKPLIQLFFAMMDPTDSRYASTIQSCVIYYTPSFFQMLHKLVDGFITNRNKNYEFRLISKEESDAAFLEFTRQSTTI
jgi:hypothetical protein